MRVRRSTRHVKLAYTRGLMVLDSAIHHSLNLGYPTESKEKKTSFSSGELVLRYAFCTSLAVPHRSSAGQPPGHWVSLRGPWVPGSIEIPCSQPLAQIGCLSASDGLRGYGL